MAKIMSRQDIILEEAFEVLAGNYKYITPEKFREKYDVELDYMNQLITITSTDIEEEFAVLSLTNK